MTLTTEVNWGGMIFLKRKYTSDESEEELFFACDKGCVGDLESPKIIRFGYSSNVEDDVAICIVNDTCRLKATAEVFRQTGITI